MKQRQVVIVIFDDVEVLDFAGPFEVFSVAGQRETTAPFKVQLVAERLEVVHARNDFRVQPHHSFETCPTPDLLLVPGGGGQRADGTPFGTRLEMNNPALLEFVKRTDATGELTLSVCTGALVLGKAGLLEGLAATTHHLAFDALRAAAPNTRVVEGVKLVDAGRVVTSGGISAGIDMSLSVVARLLGHEVALETASYMEYDWKPT
jgi:transcriptional regulator GlxA family with amidase domain